MNNKINKKKKKGFTLIELIAVIAILAILGAIIVPKVTGYGAKANTSKDLANSKSIIQAIEQYNTEHENSPIKGTDTINTALLDPQYIVMPTLPKTKTSGAWAAAAPTTWAMTYDNLQLYASQLDTKAASQ